MFLPSLVNRLRDLVSQILIRQSTDMEPCRNYGVHDGKRSGEIPRDHSGRRDAYYGHVPSLSWRSFWISLVVTKNSEFSMCRLWTKEGLTDWGDVLDVD